MKILFIADEEVSLRRGRVRTVAMLFALADAGHRIDVLSADSDLRHDPHIEWPAGGSGRPASRVKRLREGWRSVLHNRYDAVHAVDEAVFFAARLCRWKKIPLVYDAVRCFGGRAGTGVSGFRRLLPAHFQRMELRVLRQAALIFSSCSALTADLAALEPDARLMQLEDVPTQPLYKRGYTEPASPDDAAERRAGPTVVCSALPGHQAGLRSLLIASRKAIESIPSLHFIFQGIPAGPARKMAASLDIKDRCRFLPPEQPGPFLSALEGASAVLMLPPHRGRYIHPQVYTLLQAGAPLVTLQEAAYDELLNDQTSIRVLSNADSLADGIIRAVQEPLFSMALGMAGQQLMTEYHTFSSFKHRIRMALHDEPLGAVRS